MCRVEAREKPAAWKSAVQTRVPTLSLRVRWRQQPVTYVVLGNCHVLFELSEIAPCPLFRPKPVCLSLSERPPV